MIVTQVSTLQRTSTFYTYLERASAFYTYSVGLVKNLCPWPTCSCSTHSSAEIIKPRDGYRSIGIQNLPKDIIMDILSRLSVHSLLLECTLVSREWQDIIVNNPIFATLQHNRALENQSSNLGLMFYRTNSQGVNLYFLEREDVGRRKLRVMDAMLTKPTGFKGRPRILGSCNGLICISSNEIGRPAYVTNPITGEFMILPSEERKNARIVGMGFDSVKKEFKVVRMPLIEDDDSMKAEIYTLGTNAWRQKGNFTQRSNKFSNVLVNGSLHWCKWKAPLFITSLDISDEQLGVVPTPKFTDTRSFVHLMAWKDYLTVVEDSRVKHSLIIWVTKEYNVKESWTKQFNGRWPLNEIHYWPLDDERGYWPFYGESLKDAMQVTNHPCFGAECHDSMFRMRLIVHLGSLVSLKTIEKRRLIEQGS